MAFPHSQSIEEVLAELGTRPSGLTLEEIETRIKETGHNILPREKEDSLFLLILAQFRSFVVYILFGAALLSAVTGHWIDAGVIITVILLNVGIGFGQTYRAERAIKLLGKLVVKKTKVIRDGKLREILARDIVPGDILFIEQGDSIPADARLIEVKNLSADESSLTGESLPAGKVIHRVSEDAAIPDQKNMIWMGTSAVEGEATAVVITTGRHTEFGKIARAVQKIKRPKTHFEKKAEELVKIMVGMALLGAAITFFIGFFIRRLEFFEIFLFSIASLVSGIPEGLPAALAIVLAVGSWRMARRKAIIRRLPAVETLGSVDVILTDKTGTLTQNTMEALRVILSDSEITIEQHMKKDVLRGTFFDNEERILPLEHPQLTKLLHIATLANNAEIIQDGKIEFLGNPTALALLILGTRAGVSKEALRDQEIEVDELPFNQKLKLHTVLINHKAAEQQNESRELYVAGAFERIIEKSTTYLSPDGEKKLNDKILSNYLDRAETLMNEGYRLIGIGYRKVPNDYDKIQEKDIDKMIFVGIVALSDPIRKEVPRAISKAQHAGIRVIMVTGDHPTTAMSVARTIGLMPVDKTPIESLLTGSQVAKLDDEELTEQLRMGTSIFARVSPVTKLRITKLMQKEGHLVAVSGDGTNDAPALKQADIGIAMGKHGTDVARESAEMVLADDNFASIVYAVEEGRAVFTNIRKVSFFLIATNVGEDITIIAALAIGLGLPLLPIHVLWLNLVTDGSLVPPLALEPKHDRLLDRPSKPHESILSWDILPVLLFTGILMALGTLFLYQKIGGGSDNPEHARTLAFTGMAFFQIFNALNLRSLQRSIFTIKPFSNKWLVIGILVSVMFQVLAIHLPQLLNLFFPSSVIASTFAGGITRIFGFSPLSLREWLLVVLVASSVFFAMEAYKYIRFGDRKKRRKR